MRGTRCPHQASLLKKYFEPNYNILHGVEKGLDLKLDSFYNFVVRGGDDGDRDDEAQHVYVGDVGEMPDWINILRCSPLNPTTEASKVLYWKQRATIFIKSDHKTHY